MTAVALIYATLAINAAAGCYPIVFYSTPRVDMIRTEVTLSSGKKAYPRLVMRKGYPPGLSGRPGCGVEQEIAAAGKRVVREFLSGGAVACLVIPRGKQGFAADVRRSADKDSEDLADLLIRKGYMAEKRGHDWCDGISI